jgi:hypothetical protein
MPPAGAADMSALLMNVSKDTIRTLITEPESILDELTASLLPFSN